jgi:GlpG protein
MRQIGTLPDADAARALADYLFTLKIETRLDQDANGWAVWVCDEDRVDQARQLLAEYAADPKNERYRAAMRAVAAQRAEERAAESEDSTSDAERPGAQRPAPPRLTLALVFVCVGVAVLTNFGSLDQHEQPDEIVQRLSIASYRILMVNGKSMTEWHGLKEVERGEVWRLLTPIFLHFGIIHLLFNVLMLGSLAGPIEQLRGPWRLAILVVVIGVGSNLAQYIATWMLIWGYPLGAGPRFGGMSGVLYGLFGYVWIKARLEPELGFVMPSSMVVMMGCWFLLCMTGLVGPIANVAHGAGFVLGVLIALGTSLAGRLFRHRRHEES